MGLDTFAARTPRIELTDEDVEAFEVAQPELCGGMCSGGWEGFRGKVYADVVRYVTGVSLYEEWIPPETVRKMAGDLEACDPEGVAAVAEEELTDVSPHEIIELGRFFRICADRGLGLVGWW